MLTLLTGITAGAIHVASGPDHLAALAPIALRSRTDALRSGAVWGVGHGLGVVLIGLVAVALRGVAAATWLSDRSEQLVGFLLLGVGAWALRTAASAPRQHEGRHHVHAALGVGVLHGAAGTGHLLAVLPALALPPALSLVYLAGFLLGAVAAMAAFAAGLGALARSQAPSAIRGLTAGSGLAAIGIGAVWIARSVGR